MTKQVVVLLATGFEEVEAVTAIDYLWRSGLKVTVLAIGANPVRGNHDLSVVADLAIGRYLGQPDAVVVPGGLPGAQNVADNPDARRIILEAHQRGALVAAICAAPAVVLGPLGLLAGKRFTCFPGREADVVGGSALSDPVVVDGTIITSRAAGTSGQFAKAIVAYLSGAAAAQELAERVIL
jgi:4-methyl-5(b-hydroxyethyl)-thiazole monophosphate biosynthesis